MSWVSIYVTKENRGMKLSLCCLAVLLSLSTTLVRSQTSTSSITGQVTDQQNAAIVGAEVKMTDVATNAAQSGGIGRPPASGVLCAARPSFSIMRRSRPSPCCCSCTTPTPSWAPAL